MPDDGRQRAAEAGAGARSALGERQPAYDVTDDAARAAGRRSASTLDGDPARRARRAARARPDASRCSSSRCSASRSRRRSICASREDQRDPVARRARASTAACRRAWSEDEVPRAHRRGARRRDGYELEFTEQVVGNRSPLDSPLMDAIAAGSRARTRAPRVVPTDAARPSPTRAAFRDAFPDCVAYGFFPQREHDALRDLRRSCTRADERIARARPRLRRRASTATSPEEAARMTDDAGSDKLRLGGMALRNGLLVHGPTHWAAAVRAATATIAVASGPKPRVRGGSTASPACAGVAAPRRGDGRHPAGQARAARGAAAVRRTPRVLGVDGRRGARRRALLRRRARGVGGEAGARRARRSRRRSSRCAAASWPPTTASSTRRSPPTSTDDDDAARRGQGARPLRLAPDGADAGRQPRRARCCCARVVERPAPLAGAAVALASIGGRGRGLRLVRAPRRLAARRARCGGPGYELQRVARHARADERAARGRPRRAGRDPARRDAS